MNRVNLQDCINVFNTNPIMQDAAVRNMEALSEWSTAAIYWRKLNREEDAKACELIHRAIGKGDCYRDAVKPLNEWVNETVEKGIMSFEDALKVIYPEMNKLHKKYIG